MKLRGIARVTGVAYETIRSYLSETPPKMTMTVRLKLEAYYWKQTDPSVVSEEQAVWTMEAAVRDLLHLLPADTEEAYAAIRRAAAVLRGETAEREPWMADLAAWLERAVMATHGPGAEYPMRNRKRKAKEEPPATPVETSPDALDEVIEDVLGVENGEDEPPSPKKRPHKKK